MMISPRIFESFSNDIRAGFFGKPEDFAPVGSEDKIFIYPHFSDLSSPLLLQPQQVHGKTLLCGNTYFAPHTKEGDGVYTTQKNMGCTVKTADCIGLLLYHPPSQTIAALHAGWRGLSQKIFTEFFLHSHIPGEEFFVALSPSLGPCCSVFSDPYRETPEFFHPYIFSPEGESMVHGDPLHIDLWKIAKDELLQNGVVEDHIEMPAFCSKCDAQKRFWSHRRGDAERNIGAIVFTP